MFNQNIKVKVDRKDVNLNEPDSPTSTQSMPIPRKSSTSEMKQLGNYFLEKVNQRANIFNKKRVG